MNLTQSKAFVVHEQESAFAYGTELGQGRARWRTLLSADETPTDSITVGIAEIEPGAENGLRPHRHAQPEVYYILSGRGMVRISDQERQARPGTAIFIPGRLNAP